MTVGWLEKENLSTEITPYCQLIVVLRIIDIVLDTNKNTYMTSRNCTGKIECSVIDRFTLTL